MKNRHIKVESNFRAINIWVFDILQFLTIQSNNEFLQFKDNCQYGSFLRTPPKDTVPKSANCR